MASVPCSTFLSLDKDGNREGQMVAGVPAKEEDHRLQGPCFNQDHWSRLWPFCKWPWEAKRAHCSALKEPWWQVTHLSTGAQQELQPPQWWNWWQPRAGFSLQWADVSQEHEGVPLRSVEGEEEGALKPSNTGERDRVCGNRERGHTVTVRKRRRCSKTALQSCWKKGEGFRYMKMLLSPGTCQDFSCVLVMMVMMKMTRCFQPWAQYCRITASDTRNIWNFDCFVDGLVPKGPQW